MSMRFQSFGQSDTQGFLAGDDRWIGIDMTRDRDKAGPGMLRLGENTRLRNGTVRQRYGTQIPQDFNPSGGFSNFLVGSGIFRNPNGDEVLLVAPANATYTLVLQFSKDIYQVDYATAVTVPPTAPSGNNGSVLVEFCQSFDSVHMFRIPLPGTENLVWDGVAPASGGRWKKTVLSPIGATLVPPTWFGEPWGDRMITYKALWPSAPERDTWNVSDLYDYTSYDPVYQKIRTNAAQSDSITRIKAYLKSSAIIYKNKSISMATDLFTFPFSVSQRKLSDLGSNGIHMPLDIGGDQIFLSQPNGFYRLSEVIQDNIIAVPLPISERIQKVIDQINWQYTAILGCSELLDNYAFFGVCIGSTQQRPNCILVYNTQTSQWESAGDTWRDPTFAFNRLHVLNFAGVQRLCAVDYQSGVIYLLYEGVRDELKDGSFSVPFKMESRGYTGDDPLSLKRFGRARVAIAGWDPQINVTAIVDGVNEEFLLTENPITKDNSTFYSHGAERFEPGDDSSAPYREDYSISDFDNFAVETFEGLPEGTILFIPGSLFQTIGDTQEVTEALMVRQLGRWSALRVENDEGWVEVKGLTVEGITGPNAIRLNA